MSHVHQLFQLGRCFMLILRCFGCPTSCPVPLLNPQTAPEYASFEALRIFHTTNFTENGKSEMSAKWCMSAVC